MSYINKKNIVSMSCSGITATIPTQRFAKLAYSFYQAQRFPNEP